MAAPPRMAVPHCAHERARDRALAAYGGRLLGAASRSGCATWWPTVAVERAQVARRWAQRAPRLARRRAAGCRTLCVVGGGRRPAIFPAAMLQLIFF
ncbi:hypothetical protein F511_45087 [Dorcoceras hygrometricum]|uniref:Uncharacterized protein n=1 Tax=Dorcoceras hygrometricum TaxID=472368 RepID=A0A2Z6ZXG0_9LAMI|nr:hypothetical protein F511_45087 [Dorcoceras hygrometricum]